MAAAPVLPASPAPTPEPAPLSEGARIIDTFIAPSKTFTDLRRSASWWAPFLLVAIVSMVLCLYRWTRRLAIGKITENQMPAQPKAAAQFEKLHAGSARAANAVWTEGTLYSRHYGYGSPRCSFWSAIVAALLFATFKVRRPAQKSRSRSPSPSWCMPSLPIVIEALARHRLVYCAGASPDGFHISNPVATNPAYFLNPADSRLSATVWPPPLDVFMIWTLILTAIGFTCASKVKRRHRLSPSCSHGGAVLTLAGRGRRLQPFRRRFQPI